MLAELHEHAGCAEAAIAAWERALGIDPICEAAARRLAEQLDHLGRLDDAIEVGARFRRNLALVELEPSDGAETFFGGLHRRQRDIARVEARRREARLNGSHDGVGDDGAGPEDFGR